MRTFYWDARVVGRRGLARRRLTGRAGLFFRTGNAGDIFNRDLIRMTYGVDAQNVLDDGRRLLLVGSVAHLLRDGDVVCGIGTQDRGIPSAAEVRCTVIGVRGPLTLEAFAAAGHDVSRVRFQLDPGLLIRKFVTPREPAVGRVIMIPHYRERDRYLRSRIRGVVMVDIDAEPVSLAREIQKAELVYTSSLHGMVFAHALGRPCVLVAPLTAEPIIKYQDYAASVGLPWAPVPSFDEARRRPAPTSPHEVHFTDDDFALPSLDELRAGGIAD